MVSLALLLTPFVVMLLVGELMPGVVAHDAMKKDDLNHQVDNHGKDASNYGSPATHGMLATAQLLTHIITDYSLHQIYLRSSSDHAGGLILAVQLRC